jgi:hypothetical protein
VSPRAGELREAVQQEDERAVDRTVGERREADPVGVQLHLLHSDISVVDD